MKTKNKSISIRKKCLFFLCLVLVSTTSCSNFDIDNELNEDMLKNREEINIIDSEDESESIKNKELAQNLLEISFNSIKAQNKVYNGDLKDLYTDKFITSITENQDDFYRKLTATEMGDYPVIFYYSDTEEYNVIMYVMEKGNDSALFQHIFIKEISSGNLKIFDIQYDG